MLFIIVWNYCAGGFSCERTNLLGLHQLHRRTLWVVKRAVGTNLWPGIISCIVKITRFGYFSNCYCFIRTFKWMYYLVGYWHFPVVDMCADACYINKIDKQMFWEESEVRYDTLTWWNRHCLLFANPLFQLVCFSALSMPSFPTFYFMPW